MYPHERSLVEQLAGKPFALIGVNSDDNRDAVRQITKEKNLNWRSFWDGVGGPIARSWNIQGWPTTFLIDANGVIRHKNLRGGELDRAIEGLLAEMGQEVHLEGDSAIAGRLPWFWIALVAMVFVWLAVFFRNYLRLNRAAELNSDFPKS